MEGRDATVQWAHGSVCITFLELTGRFHELSFTFANFARFGLGGSLPSLSAHLVSLFFGFLFYPSQIVVGRPQRKIIVFSLTGGLSLHHLR